MKLELRPYQQECVKDTNDALLTYSAVFNKLPTAAGKTVIMGYLMQEWFKKDSNINVLIVSHTKELVSQPVQKLKDFFPELYKRAGYTTSKRSFRIPHCDIVSTSIQKLYSAKKFDVTQENIEVIKREIDGYYTIYYRLCKEYKKEKYKSPTNSSILSIKTAEDYLTNLKKKFKKSEDLEAKVYIESLTINDVCIEVGWNYWRELNTVYKFDYIIYDECHHSVSESGLQLWEYAQLANPKCKIVGFTATPERADGRKMSLLYEKRVTNVTMGDMIAWGYLIMPEFKQAELPDADFSELSVSGSGEFRDYGHDAVANVLDAENNHVIIYDKWLELASEKKTMCFTGNVKHAKHLCEYFSEKGVLCAIIAGADSKTGIYIEGKFQRINRTNLIRKKFEEGEYKVLFNCMVLTEGTDIPCVDCIMIARPTRNISLMIQIVGRALRLFPGKERALIISFLPINAKKVITGWKIMAKIKKQMKECLGMVAPAIEQLYNQEDIDLGVDINPDEVEIRAVDLFDKSEYRWFSHAHLAVCGIGAKKDRWGWYRIGVAVVLNHVQAQLQIDAGIHQYSFENEEARWGIVKFMSRQNGKSRYEVVGVGDSVDNAIDRANILIAQAVGDNGKVISDKDNGWHKESLSDLTVAKLAQRGLPNTFVNQGNASRAIYWVDCFNALFPENFLAES